MGRAGLITLEQARAAGLSFDEPEPRACPHCGATLEPLGAALAGRVAWVSAAPCPCEGAAREREAEERRRAESESTPIPLTPSTPPSWTGTVLWTSGIELMSALPLIFHGR